MGFILGSGQSPKEGHGNPLQYACLEYSMDRGAWWATVHKFKKPDMTEVTWQQQHTPFQLEKVLQVYGQ